MLDKLALLLTIIGGINWGSIGIFQYDLVAAIRRAGRLGKPNRVYDCGPGSSVVHLSVFPRYSCNKRGLGSAEQRSHTQSHRRRK